MLATRALQYIRASGGLAARRQRIQRISGIVADAKAFGLRQQVERTPIALPSASNERALSGALRRWPEPLQLAAAELVEEALALGALKVLHAPTALLRANAQFEEGNGSRSFGLLGDGCMARALEAKTATRMQTLVIHVRQRAHLSCYFQSSTQKVSKACARAFTSLLRGRAHM